MIIIACLALLACGKQDNKQLFNEYFEPYVDLVSGQETNERIQPFLDGMALYNSGDHENALPLINGYSKANRDMAAPFFYMGICYLAISESAKAELMFDHLDNLVPNGFIDQSEWYTALCLLYSNQPERCRTDLELIIDQTSHAYFGKANELLEAMESNGL